MIEAYVVADAQLRRAFAEEIGKGDTRELVHGGPVILAENGAGILIGPETLAGGKQLQNV
jgi:hypothetical protein